MKRPLAAVLLTTALLGGTAACSGEPPDTTGDSNTERQTEQDPGGFVDEGDSEAGEGGEVTEGDD